MTLGGKFFFGRTTNLMLNLIRKRPFIRKMTTENNLASCEHKKLFTPGPLGVSMSTKQAMLRDVGSRDLGFIETIESLRNRLVSLSGGSPNEFTCVPMQGSGSFAIEAVLSTVVPPNGKVLILENGAYGRRQGKMCDVLKIPYKLVSFPEDCAIQVDLVKDLISQDKYRLVSAVQCETSSGIMNPIFDIGQVLKQHTPEAVFFVDAMSSFGAVPISMEESKVDYLVSSANKCLEGVPGFSFVICRKQHLLGCKGQARSYVLDLVDQLEGLEKTGQFRFTPPTHSMLALHKALQELDEEGGVSGRSQRYQENRETLRQGMNKLGFKEFLKESLSGYIITSFQFPKDTHFNFTSFYQRLSEEGHVIYPGKVLDADCFRIGNIGHLFPSDMKELVSAIEKVCLDMHVQIPVIN